MDILCGLCAAGLLVMVLWQCIVAANSRTPFSAEPANCLAEPIIETPPRIPRPPELGIQLAEAIYAYRQEHDEVR